MLYKLSCSVRASIFVTLSRVVRLDDKRKELGRNELSSAMNVYTRLDLARRERNEINDDISNGLNALSAV